MGFWDGVVSAGFKTDHEGRVLYYPWSRCRGYILSGLEKKEEIQRFVKMWLVVSAPLVLLTATIVGWFVIDLAVAWGAIFMGVSAVFFWRWWSLNQLLEGVPVTVEKLTIGEAYRNIARVLDPPMAVLLKVSSVLVVVLGAMALMISPSTSGRPGFWTDVILWIGLGSAMGLTAVSATWFAVGYVIRVKVKQG